ncbi:hypothetical protein SNE40_019241 [Patella caerulea]|uniref:Uncharacterized protein n=1 Tax=Patella caerulea TaxID=87958 RepID=A0AAN8PF22_PATCE
MVPINGHFVITLQMSQSIVLLATISLVITDLEKSTAEPQKYVMCGMDPCDKGERFCDKIDMICSPCKYLESYCRTNDKDVGCLMYNCISTVSK